MKKRWHLIFVMSLFFSINLIAQTPGYMGKRLVIGYGFHFSPAFIGSNGKGQSIIGRGNSESGVAAFNSLHQFFLEFAISKRVMVGASVSIYKTTYDNNKTLDVSAYQKNKDGSYSALAYFGSPTGLYNIKGQNYALYAKLFRKSHLAPCGKYIMLGINIRRYTSSYDPNIMQLEYQKNKIDYVYPAYSDFGRREQSFTRFDLLFGFGRTRILFHRVAIDYGINVNVYAFLASPFDATSDNDDLFNHRSVPGNYIETTSAWRTRGVNSMNAYLKVGILLF
jgi:hypothetical protein